MDKETLKNTMRGIALNTERCKNCDFSKFNGAHNSLACIGCECDALYEAGYRQQKEIVDGIKQIIKDNANSIDHMFATYAFVDKILLAIDDKYGGDKCQE